MNLAQLEEADRSYDAAIARYQRILELQPSNVVALNNLAYALAARNAPAEGLPLAKRAAALAPRSGRVIDTLAWIEHLLGNERPPRSCWRRDQAGSRSERYRLHAATVAAARAIAPTPKES